MFRVLFEYIFPERFKYELERARIKVLGLISLPIIAQESNIRSDPQKFRIFFLICFFQSVFLILSTFQSSSHPIPQYSSMREDHVDNRMVAQLQISTKLQHFYQRCLCE